MHVAVMGAGSLGSLLGGLLASRHRVTLVGREEHMRAVARDGLRLTGAYSRTVHPATTTSWTAVDPPDVALVTVKSYDTAAAAEAIGADPPPTVATLQNGLGNVDRLADRVGQRATIIAGTVTYGARLEAPGEVSCTGRGEIALGLPDGGRSPAAEELAAAFQTADVAAKARMDMPRRLWEKVAVNAAINPVTALARVRNGAIREPPLRPIALAAAREVARVARKRGHDLSTEDVLGSVESVARRTADNESSMARDVRRGQRTEIEAITGTVIERADPAEVPVNRVLYGLLVGYERARTTDLEA